MKVRTRTTEFVVVIFLTFLMVSSAGSVLVKATSFASPSSALIVSYTFQTPAVSQTTIAGETYSVLTTPTATLSGNPGEPDLPIYSARILLPYNEDMQAVSVTPGPETVLGAFNVLPVDQAHPLLPGHENDTPVAEKNASIYSADQNFPSSFFTTTGAYFFRGYQILVLELHPVQYNPITQKTVFYTDFQVTVTTKPSSAPSPLYRGGIDEEAAREMIDNPAILDTYPHIEYSPVPQYELLILTTNALKDAFIPLKNAHDARGVPTVIKTLFDVGGRTTDDIRNYIRTAYQNWGINYVLLGGDNDVVPAQNLYAEVNVGATTDSFPSDLFYACLDGPYNYDGDSKWGEPHDGANGGDVDLIAEVYVGRACVGNVQEVNNFVNKTITYMNYNSTEPFLNTFLMAGEKLDNVTWGDDSMDNLIQTAIPPNTYTIHKLYDRDHVWTKDEIIAEMNAGVHMINHLGHANQDYVMKLDSSDVDQLTNTKLFFVYTQGCYAGAFDIGDCIAEHFTIKTTHAAFAGVLNARYGWYIPGSANGLSQMYHRSFVSGLLKKNQGTIGRTNHYSKEYYVSMINQNGMRWCYYQTNLFGDPTLVFYLSNSTTSDLSGSGTLTWTGATPGATVNGSFTISNIGAANSMLSWKIIDYPSWGTWSFSPGSGDGLTPGQGPVTVNVSVVVPNKKGSSYVGTIKVVNVRNYNDYFTVSISLTTPLNQELQHPYIHQFLQKLLQRFPFLNHFISLHPALAQLLGLS
jgi:hypothetical protein